jgi:hypothetical protein
MNLNITCVSVATIPHVNKDMLRGRDADLAAEFVALVCFPRADAFHRWLVNTVDVLFVLSLLRKDSSGGFQ